MNNPDYSDVQVLVIDDEPRSIALMKVMFGIMNIKNLINCRSGEEALAVLEQEPRIDLVVIDLQLPVVDGYQVFDYLRPMLLLQGVPIVAITALVLPDYVTRAEAAQFDGFIG